MVRNMPKFTTKDLMISITLISLGMGLLGYLFRIPYIFDEYIGDIGIPNDYSGSWVVLWFGAGAAIGGGLGSPFKHGIAGAFIGAQIQFVTLFPLLTFMQSRH